MEIGFPLHLIYDQVNFTNRGMSHCGMQAFTADVSPSTAEGIFSGERFQLLLPYLLTSQLNKRLVGYLLANRLNIEGYKFVLKSKVQLFLLSFFFLRFIQSIFLKFIVITIEHENVMIAVKDLPSIRLIYLIIVDTLHPSFTIRGSR
ncbi:hypothetical protein L9F63_013764, partial [Diploptera punctata]